MTNWGCVEGLLGGGRPHFMGLRRGAVAMNSDPTNFLICRVALLCSGPFDNLFHCFRPLILLMQQVCQSLKLFLSSFLTLENKLFVRDIIFN
jgi:hypothetical protein